MADDLLVAKPESRPRRRRSSRVLWILSACQFLYYVGLAVDLTLTGIVGLHLAPTVALATMPLTIMTVVATGLSYPAGVLSTRWGHRQVLLYGAVAAVVGGLFSAYATVTHSFAWLCAGTAVVGVYKATGGYFRYLAVDRVAPDQKALAVSTVLSGGLFAALVGPWAATNASGLLDDEFAGSYLLVSLLAAGVVVLVLMIPPGTRDARAGLPAGEAVPVRIASRTYDFRMAVVLLGLASVVMTMLMAMGPISSHHAGHSLADAALMLQWHMVGMFAPSLVSGRMTTRWGPERTGIAGAAVLLAGGAVGVLGTGLLEFTVSLALVGAGWNLLYVAGSTHVVRSYPQGQGGRVQGTVEASVGLLGATASLSAAAVFAHLGWQAANLLTAVLSAVVVCGLVATAVRRRR